MHHNPTHTHTHTHTNQVACCYLSLSLDAVLSSVTMLFIEGVPAIHPHHCHLLAVCSLQHMLFYFLFSVTLNNIYERKEVHFSYTELQQGALPK